MRNLLQAAKAYLQAHQGVTPHTDYQAHCARELHDAIAEAESTPTHADKAEAMEGHTSAGWTDDGTGREKPKMTLVEAMRQIEAQGLDLSAGMSTAPLIDDPTAPVLGIAAAVPGSSSFAGKEREMAGVPAEAIAPSGQTPEPPPQDAA